MTDDFIRMKLAQPYPPVPDYPHQVVYMSVTLSMNFLSMSFGKKLCTIGLN